MSLDEKLFGLLYAAASKVLRRARPAEPAPSTVSFDELRQALSIIACAVAEQHLELCAVDGEGEVGERRITLPARLMPGTEPTVAARCYLVRVLCDASVLRTGLYVSDATSSRAQRWLATLLVHEHALGTLLSELPGARAVLDAGFARALATRPALDSLTPPEAALEAIVQSRLGREFDVSCWPHGQSSCAWVSRALVQAPISAPQLQAALTELGTFIAGARVQPVEAFGVLGTTAAAQPQLENAWAGSSPARATSERSLRTREQVRRVDLGDNREADNPLVHSFEKLHTADVYRGGKKRADGSDELQDHAEALSELELEHVTRSEETTSSYVRSDAELSTESGEVGTEPASAAAIRYDEWDERTQAYRHEYCSVFERSAELSVGSSEAAPEIAKLLRAHAAELRALSAEFSRLRNARALRNRQPDGPDIDVDAMVDRHGALRGGHNPPDRLFLSRRRHERDLCVMLLLDASMSTDAWIAGRRVIDVAKGSLIVLSEVLRDERIPTAIAAFSSHTRKHCTFSAIKQFDESWIPRTPRDHLLQPAGYTRIGPALRHATTLLARRPARKKLLLLLSDAKPTDYDRYEGRYGISDVRKALSEAELLGITCFALAIDARAQKRLPEMFGRGQYEVLLRPQGLARALAGIYAELSR